ncbi:hypothetical protein D030_2404A, partial [Vibrio parahaemolyticus AQ3810]
MERGNL